MKFAGILLALAVTLSAQQSDRDAVLARQLAAEVERQARVVEDTAVVAYVNRVALKIAAAADLPTPLDVKVIAGDRAYAFPGALLYLNTDLILAAGSEAELAGAIAHNLGHLAQWGKTPPVQPGQIPMIFAGGGCLRGTRGIGVAIPAGAQPGEIEAQADLLGLEYLEKAGYDPGALADLYERVAAAQKRAAFQSWRTVPAATRTQADALRTSRDNWLVSTSEFQTMYAQLAAWVAALPPRPRPTLIPDK
jgi:beta-barrel assembly-enhancing protease